METFRSSIVKLPTKMGEQTCMGPDPRRPARWGNHFCLGGAPHPSIVNMVAENFEELVSNGTFHDGAVKVKLYQDLTKNEAYYAIVIDDRVPSREWLRDEPRFYLRDANPDIVADINKTLKKWMAGISGTPMFVWADWIKFWEDRGAEVTQLIDGHMVAIPHFLDDPAAWKAQMQSYIPKWFAPRVVTLLDKMVVIMPSGTMDDTDIHGVNSLDAETQLYHIILEELDIHKDTVTDFGPNYSREDHRRVERRYADKRDVGLFYCPYIPKTKLTIADADGIREVSYQDLIGDQNDPS